MFSLMLSVLWELQTNCAAVPLACEMFSGGTLPFSPNVCPAPSGGMPGGAILHPCRHEMVYFGHRRQAPPGRERGKSRSRLQVMGSAMASKIRQHDLYDLKRF